MPDFLSGLTQALTAGRTGMLQGQAAAEQEQYNRALQAQLLANQTSQQKWQREHGDMTDRTKAILAAVTAQDKTGAGAAVAKALGIDLGPSPALPPATPTPPTTAPVDTTPAPKPIILPGQEQSPPPASTPTPMGAPPPVPTGANTPPPPPAAPASPFNMGGSNAGLNRASREKVAADRLAQQKNYTVYEYTAPSQKTYKLQVNAVTGKTMAPEDAPDGSYKKGDFLLPGQLAGGIKPTAQNAPGHVSQEENLIFHEASKELKPLQDDAIKFVNAASALKSAENKNPVAYASALSKFVQATEQSTNLRQGLLFYFRDNLRPDVNGKLQLFIQRNVDGTYSTEVIAQLKAHVADMEKGIYDLYDGRWQHFAAQSPLVQRAFPSAETVFGKQGDKQSSANPSRAAAALKIEP